MRIVIVDDEPAARRTLRECCAQHPDLEVVGEFGDSREALVLLRDAPPDLLFLDVQMEPMSGIELARALDPRHLPLVVFVTAYDQYAIEAFELSATDYLLKPFDERRFATTVARVRERFTASSAATRATALETLLGRFGHGMATETPRLLAEAGGRLHMLDAARIELVESERNYVRLRVGRDTYHARSTLQQAEQALQSQPMLRISRSCLVNTAHLREISRTPRGDFILVLAGGATVTSSEGHRERVREYLDRLRLDGR